MSLDNRLSADKLSAALDLATDGCRKLKVYLEGVIKTYMVQNMSRNDVG